MCGDGVGEGSGEDANVCLTFFFAALEISRMI